MLSLPLFATPGSDRDGSQHLTTPNELLAGFKAILERQTKDRPAPQEPIA
jgi:hypothetical protein